MKTGLSCGSLPGHNWHAAPYKMPPQIRKVPGQLGAGQDLQRHFTCVSPQLGEPPWPPLMQQTSLSTSSSHPFSPSFPFLQAAAGLVAGLRESPDPLPPSHLQPASQTTAALPGTSQALDASGNPLQRKKIKGGELLKTKGGRGGGRAQRILHTCLSSYQR